MVKKLIIGLILLFQVMIGFGQSVPWKIMVSGSINKAQVVLKVKPTIDGVSITNRDYIGVFDSIDNCYGLRQWKDTINFDISISGSSDGKSGFVNGSPIRFKLWIESEDCIADQMMQVSVTDSLRYQDNSVTEINTLNFTRLTVKYPITRICQNAPETFVPIFSYTPQQFQFSGSAELKINTLTGSINPAQNVPGIYTINYNANKTCLTSKSATLSILDIPEIIPMADTTICPNQSITINPRSVFSNIEWSNGASSSSIIVDKAATISYKITNSDGCSNTDSFSVRQTQLKNLQLETINPDCEQKGKIVITQQEIENSEGAVSYSLKNILDNTETTDVNQVTEGIYEFSVVSGNGCVLKTPGRVVLEKNCLNDIPVFTPNADGQDDRYFINLEGKIRIFDRNGKLRRSLTGPVYFDGNDENNKPLAMGTYLVVSENGKKITLTLIK